MRSILKLRWLSTTKPSPFRLTVPDDGHSSVKVVSWYKKVGDTVEASDAVCEIDTPEYSYDIQTPVSGYISKIIMESGEDKVSPGDLLCHISEIEAVDVKIDLKLETENNSKFDEKPGEN